MCIRDRVKELVPVRTDDDVAEFLRSLEAALGLDAVRGVVFCIVVAALVFKRPYTQLKQFYEAHLHDIDVMLPYYLKSLEIVIQQYTVPDVYKRQIYLW